MLKEKYTKESIASKVKKISDFRIYPDAEDRKSWEGLPEHIRNRLVSEGENYLGYDWPAITATLYMDFTRTGNRERFQDIYFRRRYAVCALAYAECVEYKGRFLDDLINGIWALCEETCWVLPAHNAIMRKARSEGKNGSILCDKTESGIDLFACETAALLAWVYYLLKDSLDNISDLIGKRIKQEVNTRVLDEYLETENYSWMALGKYAGGKVNNWNPWCNSNCIASVMLLEENQERRVEGVWKCLRSIDAFIDSYAEDGGCDEGPGYWNRAAGSLFDCLEVLDYCTDGHINVFDEQKIINMGLFICYIHAAGPYYVNFADASPLTGPIPHLFFRYGEKTGSEIMKKQACARLKSVKTIFVAFDNSPAGSVIRDLGNIFTYTRMMEYIEKESCDYPYLKDTWMPDLQVMTARSYEGRGDGLFLAAKGGHNEENHNHNDVGNFIVYADAKSVFVDAGVGTYTAKTFSSERYDIWTMQSAYHNTPTINGIMQKDGAKFRAIDIKYEKTEDYTRFSLDISKAYPKEAGVARWERTFRFNRKGDENIEITENFEAEVESDISLNYLVCRECIVEESKIIFKSDSPENRNLAMIIPDGFSPVIEKVSTDDDNKLKKLWGDTLRRVVLKSNKKLKNGIIALKLFIE